jgi:hypothetical protein
MLLIEIRECYLQVNIGNWCKSLSDTRARPCGTKGIAWELSSKIVVLVRQEISNWQNLKLTKWQVDETTSWWNDKLMKWQVDKMTTWWNDNLMKWQVAEMSSWWNGKLMKWQVGEMATWWNGN